jgi:hypothetical protein
MHIHSASLCLVRFLQSSKPISLPDESIRLFKTHLVSPLAARNYISQNVSEARSAKLLNMDTINLVQKKPVSMRIPLKPGRLFECARYHFEMSQVPGVSTVRTWLLLAS